MTLIVPLAWLAACESALPLPVLDPDGGFWDTPLPRLDRTTESGGTDLTGFPNPGDNPLLADYLALAGTLDGSGTNPTITFRFEQPLDLAGLGDIDASVSAEAPLFLLDVDPLSPERGRRVPLIWDFQETETAYQPANLLTLAPLHGTPLRPATTYAAVVTTAVADPHPDFGAVWQSDHPDHDTWAPVHAELLALGVSIGDVAVATTFRTQDPVDELGEWAWWVRNGLPVPTWDQVLTGPFEDNQFYEAWEGRLSVPLWQHGERPYWSEGGAFARDDEGRPLVYEWEDVWFTLAWPSSGEMPAEGWPLVIYSHGTGGTHQTCCDSGSGLEPASMLAKAGFATLGIAQPLHGDRATSDTEPDLHTFNYTNPDAALHNFRQGALDIVYQAHALKGRAHTFDADGLTVALDPERVWFLGHSQGGITGALALPYLGGLVEAAALSGAGGGLSYTLVHRKQGGLDIEELLRGALSLHGDEELDVLHPVTGVIQTLSEVTDPLNYAPYWFQLDHRWSEGPVHVLMTEGLLDEHTPPMTTEAMAAAGGVPILDPVSQLDDAHRLELSEHPTLPTGATATAYDGTPITAGLGQYPDNDHYAIFDNSEAAKLYRGFLRTSRDEHTPLIGEDQ